MTDKQRLAVLVQLANSVFERSQAISQEKWKELEWFEIVVMNTLNEIFKCDLEENEKMIEGEMETAAIEYMFKEMEYFTEKYGKEEN